MSITYHHEPDYTVDELVWELIEIREEYISSYIYSLCGGKQWQTTPKNFPSMQCTGAIKVT